MHVAFLAVSMVAIGMNAAIAVADYARAPFVLANSREVHVPERWLPWLGTCKVAAVVGLIAALVLDIPGLGIAAAAGLVLFYIGAITFHIRAKVFYNIAFPGFFLAVAIATLTLAVTQQ